jgi:hypothetical protein
LWEVALTVMEGGGEDASAAEGDAVSATTLYLGQEGMSS